jgi:hypothetical protein
MLELCAHLTLWHRLPQHILVGHLISIGVDGTLNAGRRATPQDKQECFLQDPQLPRALKNKTIELTPTCDILDCLEQI